MNLRRKVPEWLSTTLSFVLVGLLIAAYFVSPKLKVPADTTTPQLVHTTAGDTATPFGTHVLSFAHSLTIGSTQLSVAYAVTGADQEHGLSGTSELASDTGMLFVFASDTSTAFWMKDMNYPLDIIWIGADKTVKDISPDLAPSTYPNTFAPKVPVLYVLEVPAGFAVKNGIVIGSKVTF